MRDGSLIEFPNVPTKLARPKPPHVILCHVERVFGFTPSAHRFGRIVETPEGPMAIRFADRNAFGVLDHYVRLPSGQEVLNPMRIIPNGTGSEVLFTLFQLPGMSDDRFAEDAGLVERDLKTLKKLLES